MAPRLSDQPVAAASIRKLPPLVVNQIAAGEAIERPASVVKELIENSLDAGANRIDVAIVEGGRQLIRVADNGAGIVAQEMALALTAHATSKLDDAQQLAAIHTMGFRGEALASIASVSRVRLTSRATRDGRVAEAGTRLEASGDDVSDPTPVGCAPGTIVEVRDLFFNTPARRKFLRTAPTEFGHTSDAVQRLAMAHAHVGFTLRHNDRLVFDLPPDQPPRDRCLAILGKDMDEAMIEFASDPAPVAGQFADESDAADEDHQPLTAPHVWGLAGQPSIARATGKFLYLFVNRRAVRDRNLMHAAREAYRGLMPHDRHPVAVVMLDIAPALVDVNVHPAKAEVRFRDPSRVHGLILTAIRRRLLESDLTPTATTAFPSAAFPKPSPSGPDYAFPNSSFVRPDTPCASAAPDFELRASAAATEHLIQFVRDHDPRRRDAARPPQAGFNLDDARHALDDQPASTSAADGPADDAAADTRPRKAVMQVHNSYLVTQDDDGLVIIDQHALHERVMFEQLRRRVFGPAQPDAASGAAAAAPRRLESQRLLMPEILDMPPAAIEQLEALGPLLERIGIEAQPAGPDQLAIHAFPTFLFDRGVEAGPFLRDLLDKAAEGLIDTDGPNAEESALHEILDMMACKAAVKAGDRLSDAELAALLACRDTIERASNCPHGRPTTIRLTLSDLARHFKRT